MTASWPERFVYVCTATRGAPVNIAPMLNAGPERIVGLLVLRAVDNLRKPTETEKASAIIPGKRLMQYGMNNLNLEPENMEYIDGKPDSFTDWHDVLPKAREMAVNLNAEIVFNISGGPRPVVIGTLLGAGVSRQNTPITMISFGHTSVSKKAFFSENGQLSEEVLPANLHLSLDDYLKSVGLTEINRAGRKGEELRMARESSLANAMFELTEKGERKSAINMFGRLYSIIWNVSYGGTPLAVKLPNVIRDFFADIFDGLNNTEITKTGISVKSKYDLEFLQGKWLENKIYNTVSEIFRGRGEFEIACGLDFGSLPSGYVPKHIPTISDFDLVLLGDDRLEIIEAKAVVSVKQIHPAIAKLNSHIHTLGGDAGRAWIVAPLLDRSQLDKNDMPANAQKNGIRILCGRNALRDLEKEIRKSRRI